MRPDSITLQLVSNSLLYASEEMGLALRNSAYSPNIKERMDHSAAVFDARGRLLAQAEHIPVHLGSLPWGLKNLIEHCRWKGPAFEEGSMVVSNNPYVTGTHLNDVTVAAPIHYHGELVAFAVNKAHHSDVGGRVPGSISMDATTLSEEGLVLEPSYLWKNKRFVEKTVQRLAGASRTPMERRGDLRAQLAANVAGAKRILELISKYSLETFEEAAGRAFRHSQSLMKRRISRFRKGTFSASDFLEGPGEGELSLRAKVTVSEEGIEVDYSGSHAQVDYPLNAVFGVTISGVYFVLRTLTGDDIPANHGAFSSIRVRAPRGTILNPTFPHPVGGGNVETSQRNADVVFRALAKATEGQVPAASGGSMNNVMIGGMGSDSAWAFYETIGVGLGGSSTMDGVDGIQSNMTNTMNTPIEEIERSLPIMMTKYEFRPDTSGPGIRRGGSGLVRSYRMLEDRTTFTVLADRERHSPWGLNGGGAGARTEILLRRKNRWSRIPSKSTVTLDTGDEVEVRTAGGGGFGSAADRRRSEVLRDVENGLLTPAQASRDYGVKIKRREMRP
jgi:N-methylhydantoinase B